ncbi:Fc.00g001660.m01.CDS01 [Cosmosporella sp. VM-42]
MSQPKITSKNLSYDDSLPPFLAALRAQASGARGPDPLLAAQRRSAKKRSSSEEAEDAPLVVDEDGNVVNVEVDKDGVVTESKEQGTDNQADSSAKEVKREAEGKAAIGGRKRKVGKVVGEAADEAVTKEDDKKMKNTEKDGVKDRKPKKKAKKIKLSFDEDEG